MIALRHIKFHIALFLIVAVGACDSVPGPSPVDQRPPQIETFSLAPQRIVYALLDEEAIDGDSVTVALNLTVTVQTSDTPVAQVAYAIISPDTTVALIQAGILPRSATNIYSGTVNVTLSALEVQSYPVLVYVTDTDNRLGGEARSAVTYVRSFEPGSPPVIENLPIPATIQRPGAGEPARSLLLVAEVSDVDGLNDIEQVEFWNETLPEIRFLLCDDGGRRTCGSSAESGDVTAGDGLFTRRVYITSDRTLGANTFVFEATDRAGLRSQQVRHTMEVIE